MIVTVLPFKQVGSKKDNLGAELSLYSRSFMDINLFIHLFIYVLVVLVAYRFSGVNKCLY